MLHTYVYLPVYDEDQRARSLSQFPAPPTRLGMDISSRTSLEKELPFTPRC